MGRLRRAALDEASEEDLAEQPQLRQRALRRQHGRRLAAWLVPSLALNLALASLLHFDPPELGANQSYQLELVEPEPPALPASAKPQAASAKPQARRARRPRPSRPPRRHAPKRAARPAPTQQPAPSPAAVPPPKRSLNEMLQMRAPARKAAQSAPDARDDTLIVDGHRIQRRRYADGGRLLRNPDGAAVVAPERPNFWRTQAAPKNDVARLSLAGLASLSAGRKGVLCDHLKRFPAARGGRAVHLLIDSSPSMAGSMSSAEVCAVGVANSALHNGYAVALGRFGASTVCHPPTRQSTLLRDLILKRDRLDGTLLPTTCGAMRSPGPVDLVIVSDGGFLRTDAAKLAEARQVLHRGANRGMLYLVPDARYMINPQAVEALKAIGFKVIHFGAASSGGPAAG